MAESVTTSPAARLARPDPEGISAVGRTALVSTSHPAATEAGLAALRRGGSAVDAYLAAAAVQTVVEPTMTGLGGGLAITVYEPASGRSRVIGATGALPRAEDGDLDDDGRWSGRTAVAPGWVAGAHAAWNRWGTLPWSDLFDSALACARGGFVVDQLLWGTMWEYRTVAGMYEAGREAWCPDGRLVCVGDVLRQPALARTIEQLAEQGADFVYEGEFARDWVEVAEAAGGRITLDDMAAMREAVIDLELPSLPVACGYELQTSGPMYALLLNLATVGELSARARPPEDAETLYLLLRIVEETWHRCLELNDGGGLMPEKLARAVDAVSPESAERLWPQVESGPPRPFEPMYLNTNAIVAVDETGLIAHGTHSTSSTPFGAGLMVDGVIVPRPMLYFSRPVMRMPIGWGTSLLALRDGRPVFAAGSPSISAIQNVFQNTMNVLHWGMEPGDSVQQPMFGSSLQPSRRPMVESSMGEQVIAEVERRGLGLRRVTPWEQEMGSCHAVRIDEDGTLVGAADPRRLGRAAGF